MPHNLYYGLNSSVSLISAADASKERKSGNDFIEIENYCVQRWDESLILSVLDNETGIGSFPVGNSVFITETRMQGRDSA